MKRLTVYLVAFVLLFLPLASCAPTVSETKVQVSDTVPVQTLPAPGVELSPEPVRIWTTSRQQHHPLRGGTYQNRAIDKLLYDPLIDYEQGGRLSGVLAESFAWSDDGLSLIFTLKEGVTFSDGTSLTARDAVVSLQTHVNHRRGQESQPEDEEGTAGGGVEVNNPEASEEPLPESADDMAEPVADNTQDEAGAPVQPETSPEPETPGDAPLVRRFGSETDVFTAITGISQDEEGRVVVTFSEHFRNAPGFLICPVLPATDASNLYAPTAPGTGTYRLTLVSDTNYEASTVEAGAGLSVDIRVVNNIGDAMKLMQNGELDLVLMDQDQYALYSGRQNLRFQGIPVNAYTYLRMDVQNGFLAEGDHLEQFMDILGWQQKLLENAAFPHWHSVLPVSRSDGRMPFQFNYFDYAGIIPELPLGDAPIRIVKGTSTFDAELAENIRLLLERFNYQVELLTETAENPQPAAELRLSTYHYEGYPDAYEFIRLAENGRFRPVLDAFPESAETLLSLRDVIDLPEPEAIGHAERIAYASEVRALTFQLPIIGIGVPSAGIAYSTRVEGQLKTAYNSPYTGLEDLTVWPIP